jgi:riboflavin kinase / FMN adenylyltransferase
MRVFHSLSEVPAASGTRALALGNFDGIHLGHRSLLTAMRSYAETSGRVPAVLTFHPHPVEVLNPGKKLERLTTTEEKLAVLESLGVELVLVEKFDPALAALGPEAFFERYIRQGLKSDAVFVGFNFHFGQNRAGNPELLGKLCADAGIRLHVEPPFSAEGVRVSSSAVRERLKSGDLAGANHLLGRPYSLRGTVVRGAGRGRTIGFPTANLLFPQPKCLPKSGVYVTEAVWQRQAFASVTNIGSRPTVEKEGAALSVEVHVLDFQASLYDETIELRFLERVRDEKKFASLDELKAQIARDADYATKARPSQTRRPT